MKLFRLIIFSIPLVIIGVLYARLHLRTEGCWGLAEGFYTIFLFGAGLIAICAAEISSISYYLKTKSKSELIPLFVSFLLIVAVILIKLSDNQLKAKTILYAETNSSFRNHSLTLREDNSFTIHIKEIEWSCNYSGKYIQAGDTIKLLKDVNHLSGNIFYSTYLIQDNQYLIPFDSGVEVSDTTKRLRITNEKPDNKN